PTIAGNPVDFSRFRPLRAPVDTGVEGVRPGAQVSTGAESASGPGHDDHPDVVVGVGFREGLHQLGAHGHGEGVELVRPVQGDRRDPVAHRVLDFPIAHRTSHSPANFGVLLVRNASRAAGASVAKLTVCARASLAKASAKLWCAPACSIALVCANATGGPCASRSASSSTNWSSSSSGLTQVA